MGQHRFRAAPLALMLVWPLVAQAAPADRAATIGSLLDEQTIAVLYADFGRIDVDGTLAKIEQAASDKQLSRLVQRARQTLSTAVPPLKAAGAEAYCVFSLRDLPERGPLIVLAVNRDADSKAIGNVMATWQGSPSALGVGDRVFVGPEATLELLKKPPTTARPHLRQALDAAGDAPVQLLILPSEDHRRVVSEMLPRLPDELGAGSGRAIADVQWAAVSITSEPAMNISATVQLTSNEMAIDLRNTFTSLCAALSQVPTVRDTISKVDRLPAIALPRVDGNRLTLQINAPNGNLREFLSVISQPVARAQAQANRVQCADNLKSLALAMHIYHDQFSRFPPAFTRDEKNNKPLLSWRVHMLPFLDQHELYKQFRLDEPWDSEHNRQLIKKMPAVFNCSETGLAEEGKTTFVVPVGDKSVFNSPKGMRVSDIQDGTVNTILIVEIAAANAVIWSKPDDVPVANLLTAPGDAHGDQFPAAFCDGSVQWLRRNIPVETLRLLFDPADGQHIPPY